MIYQETLRLLKQADFKMFANPFNPNTWRNAFNNVRSAIAGKPQSSKPLDINSQRFWPKAKGYMPRIQQADIARDNYNNYLR